VTRNVGSLLLSIRMVFLEEGTAAELGMRVRK
jgi:hypothetical protein